MEFNSLFSNSMADALANSQAADKEDPLWRSRHQVPIDDMDSIALMTGNSNRPLAEKAAANLGMKLLDGTVKKFADGEIAVAFDEKDVVSKHIYII